MAVSSSSSSSSSRSSSGSSSNSSSSNSSNSSSGSATTTTTTTTATTITTTTSTSTTTATTSLIATTTIAYDLLVPRQPSCSEILKLLQPTCLPTNYYYCTATTVTFFIAVAISAQADQRCPHQRSHLAADPAVTPLPKRLAAWPPARGLSPR